MTARWVASKLQEAMGQSFIVENKPGAGSNIASAHVAGAQPDGYTLLLAASQLTWNSVLYQDVKYDAVKSFAPISEIMTSPATLIVGPDMPVESVSDLISLAKAQPGKFSYASTGIGSVPHLSGELFQKRTETELLHVPYRGASTAVTDLMGGQVNLYFMTALSAVASLESSQLKPLAVTAAQRLAALPDVPTMAEAGVEDMIIESWNGLFAPANTPPAIVDKIAAAMSQALSSAEAKAYFEPQGARIVNSRPREFADKIANEVERGAAFIKEIDLKLQ